MVQRHYMIHSGSLGAWWWISSRSNWTACTSAQAMTSRPLDAGVPFAWFTADEAYGQAKYLWAGAWAPGVLLARSRPRYYTK